MDPSIASGEIRSVNVGMPIEVSHGTTTVTTGIFKAPAEGPVQVGASGLDGDGQADRSVHGGSDKAVYLYSSDSYEWWMGSLGHALQPGEFGENLTVTGLTDDGVRLGQRIRVGTALLEVTEPRRPCFKLGIRMGDPRFPARFREAGRLGFYARVIEPGSVEAGSSWERVDSAPEDALTISELHDLYVNAREDPHRLKRAAATPGLTEGWREWLHHRIAETSAN